MTQNKDFKRAVRARMRKTGERYTTARAMLLQASGVPAPNPSPSAGILPGHGTTGGVCGDTGALRNTLAAAGITAAHDGQPLTEAVVAGLCGGVGFLHAVFEYKGMPPMLSVMCRWETMPDAFIEGGLDRLGLDVLKSRTGSAAVARRALDASLDEGRAALCVVDAAAMRTDNEDAPGMGGMAPAVVAVVGRDGDDLLLDDGGAVPRRMSAERFAGARAAYKKAKHFLMVVEGGPRRLDLAPAVRVAVAATATRYHEAPYKGFASNFGLAGMEKWRRLLTDPKDRKGWPALFPEGALAYLALRRTHDGVEHEFTAPAAGRPQYAEFLAAAADITGNGGFHEAAALYREAGVRWRTLSDAIAACGDPAVVRGCELGDSIRELFDEAEGGCDGALREANGLRQSLAKECRLTRDETAAIYEDMAANLDAVLETERAASARLADLVA